MLLINTKWTKSCLWAYSYVFIFTLYNGNALDVPLRKIVIKKPLTGIGLTVGAKPLPDSGTITLPANTEITMYLNDEIDRSIGEDAVIKFSLNDLKTLSGQSPLIVQDVIVGRCEESRRIESAIKILKSQKMLQSIDLYRCELNLSALRPLSDIHSLTTFTLSRCTVGMDSSLSAILNKTTVRQLYIAQTHIDNLFGELSKMKDLRFVNISGAALKDSYFENIMENSNIKRMELDHTSLFDEKFTGDVMVNLKNFTDLQELSISVSGPNVTNIKDYRFLKELQSVRKLSLIHTGIRDSDLIYIAAMKNLEELDLSKQYKLDDADFKEITQLKKLRKITLVETDVSDEAMKNLNAMKNVEVVDQTTDDDK